MRRFLKIALIAMLAPPALLTAIYWVAVLIQPALHREYLAEKRGQVIDAETGKGVPEVTVIANWKEYTTSWFGSAGGCDFQRVVETDSDGFYLIPDASDSIDVSKQMLTRLLGLVSKEYINVVLTYKSGYVEPDVRDEYIRLLQQSDTVYFVAFNRQLQPEGSHYRTSPIVLDKRPLDHRVLLRYYENIRSNAFCNPMDKNEEAEITKRKNLIRRDTRAAVCSLPGDTILSGSDVQTFGFLVGDCAYQKGMEKISGRLFEEKPSTVGVVCAALNYAANSNECPPPSSIDINKGLGNNPIQINPGNPRKFDQKE